MRVYIPFPDGSSISFDGEEFVVHKRPRNIDAVDEPGYGLPSKAENAWNFRWEEVVRALEGAYRRQEDARRANRQKQVYRPPH